MTALRLMAAAALIAAGAAGKAEAAPAALGHAVSPAAAESEAATPVHYRHRRCWPVRRWVWTHWGWRYRHVGYRCAPPYRYYYPYGRSSHWH